MKQADSRGISGWGQLGILVGLVGVCFFIAGIVSIPVWMAMTHTSIFKMATEMMNPKYLNALLAIQVITTIIAFFLPAVVYAAICYRKKWNFLGFTGAAEGQQVLSVILIALCTLPLISLLGELNKAIPLPTGLRLRFDAAEKTYTEQVSAFVQLKTWGQYLTSLVVIAVMPAIVEETLFRGALQNLLTRWTKLPWLAIVVSAIIFSAIHLSWYGFIARMVLGMLLGLLFYYGQSIWLNILAHFINNAVVVTFLFIATRKGIKMDVADDQHFSWAVTAASVAILAGLLTWFIRSSPPPTTGASDFSINKTSNPFLYDVE